MLNLPLYCSPERLYFLENDRGESANKGYHGKKGVISVEKQKEEMGKGKDRRLVSKFLICKYGAAGGNTKQVAAEATTSSF